VVSHSCARIRQEVGKVLGLVLLDIVEGSAVDSLGSMLGIINSRPKGFDSVEQCIEWQ
jgi:protein phosphatase methylesterase 1